MIITRGFSLTNFVVASSALGFQVFVLYPWHKRLEDDFEEMRKQHLEVLHRGEKGRMDELKAIRARLSELGERRAI